MTSERTAAVRGRVDDLVANRAFAYTGFEGLLETRELDEVRGLLGSVEEAAASGRYAVGFVAYEAAPAFDPSLAVHKPDPDGPPLVSFALYRSRRAVEPVGAPEAVVEGGWRPLTDPSAHESALERAREQIRLGWTYQVNLTTRLEGALGQAPFELYRQLVSAQRTPYGVYLEHGRFALAGASPELFFELEAGRIRSRPMKGTAARGRFAAEDEDAAAALVGSEKERAENVMIVDLIRNDIGRIAVPGSVAVPELFSLERYPTVWQLTSEVVGELADGMGLVEVFDALFPCGSVTGAPKVATMSLIAELEPWPRGVYCGAVGTVEPGVHGPHARFAVAIRTATVDRASGIATYGAGGGITWDSTPGPEWAEIVAKSAVLARAPDRFGLFETMLLEAASGYRNLGRHLARMAASAAHFAIPFDENGALEVLETARIGIVEPMRARLDLARDGTVSVRTEPLGLAASDPVSLVLDTVAQDERDERLFHKTTDRSRYDEAAARHPGAGDVVLVNSRGELTETTRANLALLLEGRWVTPALECGLLAGVERGRLLDEGVLVEAVLTEAELGRATALATVSSLRGWRDAYLSELTGREGRQA